MNPRLNVSIFCRGGVARWDLFLREIESSLSISLKKRPHLATPPCRKSIHTTAESFFFLSEHSFFCATTTDKIPVKGTDQSTTGFPKIMGILRSMIPFFCSPFFCVRFLLLASGRCSIGTSSPPPSRSSLIPQTTITLEGRSSRHMEQGETKKREKQKGIKKRRLEFFLISLFSFASWDIPAFYPFLDHKKNLKNGN